MIKNSKYETTGKTIEYEGRTLHKIMAVKDFGYVKKGQIGGWIGKESNLSEEGDCWVADGATVCGFAHVSGNAQVFDEAWVCLWKS